VANRRIQISGADADEHTPKAIEARKARPPREHPRGGLGTGAVTGKEMTARAAGVLRHSPAGRLA